MTPSLFIAPYTHNDLLQTFSNSIFHDPFDHLLVVAFFQEKTPKFRCISNAMEVYPEQKSCFLYGAFSIRKGSF